MGSLTALAVARATAMSAPDATRTCDTHAEGPYGQSQPPSARDVTLGRVTFIGLGRRIPWGRPLHGDPTAKIPVVIRAGAPVTVRIRPLRRTRARLDFDPSEWRARRRSIARGAGQRSVRFEPCPPDTKRFTDGRPLGEETFYPGGFLVARRGCARLIARAPGEDVVRRRVALGVPPRRCD